MGSITGLNNTDYMALARAMDTNGNNKIDKNEANINYKTHNKIGNQNGVAGTREFADALSKGDIFLTGISETTANQFADYLSKRNENFDKPVAQWISDAWISKDDFAFSDSNKRTLDENNDNRVSRKELVTALVSGQLAIGEGRQVSQDPFQGNDPFAKPQRPTAPPVNNNPFNNDPFSKPQRPPVSNDPFNSDPFDRPQHSEMSLKLKMLDSMNSSYSKGQLLQELAGERQLTPYDQELLVDATTRHISDDYTRNSILTKVAGRSDLSEGGAIKVLKAARELNSYSAGQLLGKVVKEHRLTPEAQRSAIITAGTLGDDYSISQALTNIIRTQDLHPANKELIMDTVSSKISSDYTKNQIMKALF